MGGSSADYRDQDTDLSLLRLALGPELRLPIGGPLEALGRVAPTLSQVELEMQESSSGARLVASEWQPGADLAVGLSLRLASPPVDSSHERFLGLFLRVEAGYAWSPGLDVELSPAGSDGPVRTEPVSLGTLALSGASLRAAFGVGY
jgi:hypothetical protein